MNERPLFGGIHLHPESNSLGFVVQVPFLLSSIGFESAFSGSQCVFFLQHHGLLPATALPSKLEGFRPFICLGWNLIYDVWVVVSTIFYFHPYLGKVSNLINIFQLGWNHQLDDVHSKCTCMIFEVLCLCNFLCKRHTAVVVASVFLGLWVAINITPSKRDLLASWKVGVYGLSFCHHPSMELWVEQACWKGEPFGSQVKPLLSA